MTTKSTDSASTARREVIPWLATELQPPLCCRLSRDHALELGAAFIGTVDGVYPIMRVDGDYYECPYCGALHKPSRALGSWSHVPCTMLPPWVRGCGVIPVATVEQAVTLDGLEPTSLPTGSSGALLPATGAVHK